jgi:vacuolar protein sorting-associated protein 26
MNFLIGAFGPPCTVSIDFADAETRKQASVKKENGQTVLVPLFLGQESVVGEVRIDPVPGKKVEHTGVKIELLGQIELYFDRGSFYDFTSLGELQNLQLQKHGLWNWKCPFGFTQVLTLLELMCKM